MNLTFTDKQMPERGPYMTTVSGQQVFFYDPQPEDILLSDIAYALAGTYRWGGHTEPRWSVAQHSLLGTRLIEEELALEFLFHDAAEAYLGDMIRPIKRMPEVNAHYSQMEEAFERVLAAKFGFVHPFPARVKEFDNFICYNESRVLMKSPAAGHLYVNGDDGGEDRTLRRHFRYQSPLIVQQLFIACAQTLMSLRGIS